MSTPQNLSEIRNAKDAFDWSFDEELGAKLISKAKALRPLLMEKADEAEAQRFMTKEVFDALKAERLFDLLIPRRLGGLGLSASAMSQILAEISKGDPSAAWVLQIINGTSWICTLSSDEIQEVLFSNGPIKACGVFAPPGKAKRVDGGYIVNGEWKYSSGSRQSDWAQMGVLRENEDGSWTPGNFVYMRLSELSIKDTWFVTGMQATSSDSIVAKDVFVPEHMMVKFEKPFGFKEEGKINTGAPSDEWPAVTLLRVTSLGLLVGAAEAALEFVTDIAAAKPIATTVYQKAQDSQSFRRELGESSAKIRTARMIMERGTKAIDAAALEKQPLAPSERAMLKAEGALAVELLTQAVDRLMFLAGSSAFNKEQPLQRYWRDLNMGARHIAHHPLVNYELHGARLLDIDEDIVMGSAY